MEHARAIAVGIGIAAVLSTGVADAATGGNFVLGHSNSEGQPSSLSNTGSGPALKLHTATSSTPAFTVSNGTKISSLNSDRLDGLDSGAFQHVATASLSLAQDPAAAQHTLLAVPGLGTFDVSCSTTDAGLSFVKSASVAEVDVVGERVYDGPTSGTDDTRDTLATAAVTSDTHTFAPTAGAGSKARYTVQLARPGGRVYTVTVSLTSQDSNVAPTGCLAWATLD